MQPMRLYVHHHMPVPAKARDVLVRLGIYRAYEQAQLESTRQALKPLMPGGCMRLVPLEVKEDGVLLANREIKSHGLGKYLMGCEMALVMLSTLYSQASDNIQAAFENNRADEAVILDAAASVAVDAGLDFLMSDAARMLRPYGKTVLKRRFSPGYSDCGIENQQLLLDILSDQPFGVTLTKSCMLQPEKSVMAIGGVKHA